MRLTNTYDLGRYVRDRRRAARLNQMALAERAGVSRRWLSDLESGKPSAEAGLVFRVISALGLYLDVRPQPAPAVIRAARAEDIPAMQAIEVGAGRAFATIGMDPIAGDEPLPAAMMLRYIGDGRAWVATDSDEPVGYVLARWIDGCGHVEQVSVHPAHAGRRIGAALIDRVAAWASERGAAALTLTTFAQVAWNAPYYEKLGFRRLPQSELTPELHAIRAEEAAHGLDRWPRLAMRRDFDTPSSVRE